MATVPSMPSMSIMPILPTSLRTMLLLGAIAVVATSVFVLLDAAPPSVAAPGAGAAVGAAGIAPPANTSGQHDEASAGPVSPARSELATETAARILHGQLVGLRDGIAWTAALIVELHGTDRMTRKDAERNEHIAVARDGSFLLPLPDWDLSHAVIEASDPLHLPLFEWCRSERLARERLEVAVQPAAVLTGRVIDSADRAVPAARVCAFDVTTVQPSTDALAATNTESDGSYRLHVGAAAPLMLVAVPMHEIDLLTVSGLFALRGGMPDSNQVRDDLLPACSRVVTVLGQVAELPALVVREAAAVTGIVRWADGRPLPDATVYARPDNGAAQLMLDARDLIGQTPESRRSMPLRGQWYNGDRVACAAESKTDATGAFRLGAVHGVPVSLSVTVPGFHAWIGGGPQTTVVPPATWFPAIPAQTLTVRLKLDDRPLQGKVTVEDDQGWRTTDTDAQGTYPILVFQPENVTVRGSAPGWPSAERALRADETWPSEVVFDLAHVPSGRLRLEVVGAHRVRQLRLTLLPQPNGREFEENLVRGHEAGPFQLRVRPGRHLLRVRAVEGTECSDAFLVACEQVIDVLESGADLRIDVVHGGRIRVDVRDRNGRHVGGKIALAHPDGRLVEPRMQVREARAQGPGLMSYGPNQTYDNLPPGRYEVVLDLGAHGVHRNTVYVGACGVAEVTLRLP